MLAPARGIQSMSKRSLDLPEVANPEIISPEIIWPEVANPEMAWPETVADARASDIGNKRAF